MSAATTTGWQPIETAPSHTPILIVAKDLCGHRRVFQAEKYDGTDYTGARYSSWSVVGCGCQEGGTDFDAPTHWQPLPPPPTEHRGGGV